MTSIDVPRNTSQKLTGFVVPRVSANFTSPTTSFLVLAVPEGKKQKLNVLVNNVRMTVESTGSTPTNIKLRIAGNTVFEWIYDPSGNFGPARDDNGVIFQSLDYVLQGSESVIVTTDNTTTAQGQTCDVSSSVIQESSA